jgi:SAM-dependent methyltransferase
MPSKSILSGKNYLKVTYPERISDYPCKLTSYLSSEFFEGEDLGLEIIDIGCGIGEYLDAFSDLGYQVLGIDISPVESEHKIYQVDLEHKKIPIKDESVNFIFSKSVIEHMNNPLNLMEETYRVLTTGGKAVIMTPSWEYNYWGPFYIDHTHVTPFTRYSLEQALRLAGFKDVRVEYFYQLPFVWKSPFLKIIPKIISCLPIPFSPFKRSILPPVLNKLIRFSNEVMLIAYVEK